MSLEVISGCSPTGFDIVVSSYDSSYSQNGALHRYILSALKLDKTIEDVIIDGKGYRVLAVHSSSSKNVILLGQVVSIHGDREVSNNVIGLKKGLVQMFRALNREAELLFSHLGRYPKTMWIPTLGTGSAGLTHDESAHIIASSLSEGLNFLQGSPKITDITIAPPITTEEKTFQEILSIFSQQIETHSNQFEKQAEIEIVSEMPNKFHSDHALKDTDQDDLGRDAIAETIVTNVTRVWAAQKREKRPFAIHLSGRWGSGKSSILGFLSKKLEQETTHHPDGWVVINYNAWRMQEAGPSWWSLLMTVREQGYAKLKVRGYLPNFLDWLWRKTRTAWPWLATLSLIAFFILIYFVFLIEKPSASVWESLTLNNLWGFVLAIIGGIGSFGTLAKLIQSSNRSASETAEAIRALQSDPTAAVKKRFERVISIIGRPVVVFIDDLDRCDAKFVVDLLQSLQTAYSNVDVLYVVASDRDWIVSSYNQVYKGFLPELSRPGTPLGYLFVKKVFQLSVPVPDLSLSDRKSLTEALLNISPKLVETTASRDERVEEIRTAIADGNLTRVTEIQSEALAEGQNLADEVMRAVSNPENQKRLRHKLLDYTEIFDGNPRAIKRLINALTFRQGYILTAAEDIPFDKIVRWTVLSLQFPYTAELLAEHPTTEILDTVSDDFPAPKKIKSILGTLTATDIEKLASFG